MARGWRCPEGHEGDGFLPLPACPICGLPVATTFKPDPPAQTLQGRLDPEPAPPPTAAAEPDMTLAPAPVADHFADASASDFSAADLAFSHPAMPLADLDWLPPLPVGATPFAADETMLKSPAPVEQQPAPPVVPEEPPQPPFAEPEAHEPTPPLVAAPLDEPAARNGQTDDTVSHVPRAPVTEQPAPKPTSPMPAGQETLVKPSTVESAAPQSAPDFPTGYEILGVLGRGGMGVVYKARQIGLDRIVALKMILAGGHATTEELTRFKTEAEAVARLQHPNIVQVFDTGLRDGRPFFSLEYCEGGSLQQKFDGSPMRPEEAAALLETLARAMHFAHERGIVHRDLKPANVLLTADGTPKITDFGLAKRLEDDSGHTGTEAVLGTPTYMAPEQASGRTRQVGPAADIYALGAVFYDLLTGRPPFRGATALDTLQMVQSAEPIPPARLQPGVPSDVQTICLKCLEKEPEKRYATAGELADDLRRFLEHRPILARPATTWERARKWARRRPAAAALLVVAVLLPLVLTAASVVVAGVLYGKNEDLKQAYTRIEDQNNQLESREKNLVETSDKLRDSVRKLTQHEKVLEDKQTKLEASNKALLDALGRATRAEQDSEQNFLAAEKAADELLTVARRELRKPGFETARQGVLQQALIMSRRFTARPGNSPAAQLRAAFAHRLVADLETALGQNDSAVKNYEEAIRYFERLIQRGREAAIEGVDFEKELLDTQMRLWGVLEGGDAGRADKVLENIEARLRRIDPAKRKLPEYRRLAAVWRLNRAAQNQLRGRQQRARDDYDEVIADLRGQAADPDSRRELARVHINRATLMVAGPQKLTSNAGQAVPPHANLREARKDCEEALAILRPMVKGDPAGVAPMLGQAYRNLGLTMALGKEVESARENYEEAVRVFAGLVKLAPAINEYRHLLAGAQGDLGAHLLKMDRRDAGLKLLAASRATLAELAKSFPGMTVYRLDLARLATAEGLALIAASEPARAERPLEEAVDLLEGLVKEQPQREDVRQYLLIAIRNLIFCHDRLARISDRFLDRRSSARHVGQLVRLRQKYEQALPPLPAGATTWQRLTRYWERLTLREELASTLRARASVLELRSDHEGAARCVAEMRPLVAADWAGWVESAALLSRCIGMAREDPRLAGLEQRRLVRDYGQQALEILTPLVRRGEVDLSERLEGRDFDDLRRLFKDDLRRLRDGSRGPGKSASP